MGNPLVTETLAAKHLRIDPATLGDEAELFTAAILQSSDAIADYLKTRADEAWTPATCPPIVQAAVLRLLAHFWENRGDYDSETNDPETWDAIARLLMRWRDPALA